MSFYDEVAGEYDTAWSSPVADDIGFYLSLAQQCDGPVVELAVGTGRVAIPIALATGHAIIGIDSSPGMIDQAQTNALAAGADLDLRLGNIVDLDLGETCSLIYCPGRSLLHVPTWAQRRRLFERVAASLAPGGRFAWNVFALDHTIAAGLDGVRHPGPAAHLTRYDVADNRIDMVLDSGMTTSLWWATKNEWLGLIDVAGLELESLHGDFAGTPLGPDSSEYVFVARRP